MSSIVNWRSSLTAVERYENIEKLEKSIRAKGLSSTGNARTAAFSAETDAYNTATSKVEQFSLGPNFQRRYQNSSGHLVFIFFLPRAVHPDFHKTLLAYPIALCLLNKTLTHVQESYEAAFTAIITPSLPIEGLAVFQDPVGPGITIGLYQNCHHVASGLVSEVYRSQVVALKVITETHNVDPHNPIREIKILQSLSHASIIKLTDSIRDQQGRLVMVFPFMPLTLAKIIESGSVPETLIHNCFRNLFSALEYLHEQGIIHRDVKPSNLLLASPTGPACLSDFGTAWHPTLSIVDEPAGHKVLEVGTTCYRAPETLFGNRSYGTNLDMWAAGTMLVECIRTPPKPLFESRDTAEDGNQLGLILSMFKTIGTPTKETWPEAVHFTTPPFEWYQEFPGRSWEELLPDSDAITRDLVKRLVCYESGQRLTAAQILKHPYLMKEK